MNNRRTINYIEILEARRNVARDFRPSGNSQFDAEMVIGMFIAELCRMRCGIWYEGDDK